MVQHLLDYGILLLQTGCKVNQMGSPDLDFHLTIRIFDLEGLRDALNQKTFEVKVVETVQI